MKLIKRTAYLDRLANLRGTPDVKIITGVRRAGKSKILAALRERILSEGGANVIFIDLLDLANEPLRDYHALNDYVIAQTKEGMENVLMIDEVQECASFERTINSLQNTGRYDIYLTGSNAFIPPGDMTSVERSIWRRWRNTI